MIIHVDGNYETGSWLSAATYPDAFFIDETTETGSTLAEKIIGLYPYYTLEVEDGQLVDVFVRDKTPEELEAENALPLLTKEQLRIEQLEAENAKLITYIAKTNARIDQSEQAQADLTLMLVLEGVL
jgi:hypothetical protein